MSDELEQALGQVKKEIKASRNQPDVPQSTKPNNQETAIMATEKNSKKKSSKSEAAAPAQVVDGYTATQLAEELGMDSVTLRKGLRAIEAKKPGGRWVWPKKSDADLAEIRKQLKEWNSKPKAEKPAKKEKPAKAEKKGKDKAPTKKSAKSDDAPAKKATKKVVKKKTEAASE